MDNANEVWQPVVGYQGVYEVSNLGRVRSQPRWVHFKDGRRRWTDGRLLSVYPCSSGHLKTSINKRARFVHILVCGAFHGPKPSSRHEVRHLNGDPADNRPENLAWGTRSENMYDRVLHGDHHLARRTQCKWKHEFTPENTRIGNHGQRICLTCQYNNKRNAIVRESERRRQLRKSRVLRVIQEHQCDGRQCTCGFSGDQEDHVADLIVALFRAAA